MADSDKKRRDRPGQPDDDDIVMARMSRGKLNPVAAVLLSIILALLFVAPMPISLFKILSVRSTFALLVVFEAAFTAFLLASFQATFEVIMLISIGYGGVMWSAASNWVSIG